MVGRAGTAYRLPTLFLSATADRTEIRKTTGLGDLGWVLGSGLETGRETCLFLLKSGHSVD